MDSYIGDILSGCDRDSRNDNFAGISKADALRFANYAQYYLFGKITRKYPASFVKRTANIPIVANQEDYEVNDNLYLGTRIIKVEWSADGISNWIRLTPANPYANYRQQTGYPAYYYRENGKVRIEPIQASATGYLRITYERALDKMDIRQATINGAPTGATMTLSTIDDASKFATNAYICVSDFNGTPLLYNGLVVGLSGSTLTLAADVSTYFIDTDTTLADLNGGYVTVGKYSTTHCQLSNDAEGFISEYVTKRLYKRDARIDDTKILAELAPLEQQIIAGYEIPDKEVKPIPIADNEILVYPVMNGRRLW